MWSCPCRFTPGTICEGTRDETDRNERGNLSPVLVSIFLAKTGLGSKKPTLKTKSRYAGIRKRTDMGKNNENGHEPKT